MRKFSLLFSLILLLSSCQNNVSPTITPSPTSGDAPLLQFVADIETLAQNFSQIAEAADASSVEELPQIIRQLQAIQSDVQSLPSPPLALETKAALDSYMHSKIQCYFKYLVTPNSATELEKDLCSLSASKLNYFRQKLNELKE